MAILCSSYSDSPQPRTFPSGPWCHGVPPFHFLPATPTGCSAPAAKPRRVSSPCTISVGPTDNVCRWCSRVHPRGLFQSCGQLRETQPDNPAVNRAREFWRAPAIPVRRGRNRSEVGEQHGVAKGNGRHVRLLSGELARAVPPSHLLRSRFGL